MKKISVGLGATEIKNNVSEHEILIEQKDEIIKILFKCWDSCDGISQDEKLDMVYKMIHDYIEVKKHRFLYSVVSNYVYGLDDNIEEALQNFLDNLVNYVEKDNIKLESQTGKAIIKLWDHINLALSQENYIKTKQSMIALDTRNLEYRLSSVHQDVYNVTNKMENLTTQLISIVSIFTAISFVVFGGISSFQNIFSNIENVSLSKLMIIGCIWAFAIINLVYMFIYYIAKLTNKNIKTNLRYNATFIQRHPLIIYINATIITIFILSIWVKIIEILFGLNFIIMTINKSFSFLIIGSVVVLITLIIMWNKIIKKSKYKDNIHNNSEYLG